MSAVATLRKTLLNEQQPMPKRYRALFSLRHLASNGDVSAIEAISACLAFGESDLLKHELAYCLGQTKDARCIKILQETLSDRARHAPIVRHEAAEALGAISDPASLALLTEHRDDESEDIAVRETCDLAVQRIHWEQQQPESKRVRPTEGMYLSIDPAPPFEPGEVLKDGSNGNSNNDKSVLANNSNDLEEEISELSRILDSDPSLFRKYRAMFRLRDIGTQSALDALSHGMHQDSSALLRHECAYILGQMSDARSAAALRTTLQNVCEADMVRHEAAEALGSIGSDEVRTVLERFSDDGDRIVRESCEVALDMWDYEKADEKEYALIPTEQEIAMEKEIAIKKGVISA